MQRPGAVVGHEVGDIDQRVDRAQADRRQALLQPLGRRTVLDAAHQPQRKTRAQRGVFHRHLHRAGEFALDRLDGGVLELAHVGGGEIARDAVHAGAVLAVRRQIDFKHGIAEAGPFGIALADRRIGRQLHDAVMVFGNLQLGRRAQHAAAFDAADGADAERDVLARNERAGRREHADEAGARIRRAAHHLHRRAAVAGIDHADAQPVRVRMLLGRNHPRNRKRRKRLRLVLDVLDLEPDHGQLVGKLFQRLVGVEMFLQPGEREFHDDGFSCPLSRLRGRVRVGALSATAVAIVSRTPDAICHHVEIAETKDFEALGFDHSRARSVGLFGLVGEMLSAIEFDHEFRRVTYEVGDEVLDRDLAAEAGAVQAMVAQCSPEETLGVGRVFPERPRIRAEPGRNLPVRIFSDRPSTPPMLRHPHPNPPPQAGEGVRPIARIDGSYPCDKS